MYKKKLDQHIYVCTWSMFNPKASGLSRRVITEGHLPKHASPRFSCTVCPLEDTLYSSCILWSSSSSSISVYVDRSRCVICQRGSDKFGLRHYQTRTLSNDCTQLWWCGARCTLWRVTTRIKRLWIDTTNSSVAFKNENALISTRPLFRRIDMCVIVMFFGGGLPCELHIRESWPPKYMFFSRPIRVTPLHFLPSTAYTIIREYASTYTTVKYTFSRNINEAAPMPALAADRSPNLANTHSH